MKKKKDCKLVGGRNLDGGRMKIDDKQMFIKTFTLYDGQQILNEKN